ncbi:hypothetical protein QF030_000519 [Streptomyces rishiriensis]|uniref:Uncharacterized protein n=1 Tax=Streptomyces rishiriensis TaxID=68264 RepID=A0ABU0NGW2_STRRH|nr:hypothetical protein [Streptomyces rishiriensis]
MCGAGQGRSVASNSDTRSDVCGIEPDPVRARASCSSRVNRTSERVNGSSNSSIASKKATTTMTVCAARSTSVRSARPWVRSRRAPTPRIASRPRPRRRPLASAMPITVPLTPAVARFNAPPSARSNAASRGGSAPRSTSASANARSLRATMSLTPASVQARPRLARAGSPSRQNGEEWRIARRISSSRTVRAGKRRRPVGTPCPDEDLEDPAGLPPEGRRRAAPRHARYRPAAQPRPHG